MADIELSNPNSETKVVPERRTGKRRKHRNTNWHKFVKRMKRIRWSLVLISIVVAVVLFVGISAVLVTDSLNRLDKSQTSLNRVLTSLNNRPANEWTYADFERLQSSVNEVSTNLKVVQSRTAYLKPLVSPFSKDADNLFRTVEVAEELTTSVDLMLAGTQPAAFYLTEGNADAPVGQISSGERVVELLQLGQGQFTQANEHLSLANQKMDAINQDELSEDLLLNLDNLDQYLAEIQDINNLLIQSPDLFTTMLGLDETQTYLVLSANNDELRPSGGYISTYGWLTVRNGRILDYNYSPTTDTSPNPPPNELASELNIPDWWIKYGEPIYMAWDGSWSPDFAETAQRAAWYYDQGDNPQSPVDGVISIDITGLQYLLEALGEVNVEGYDAPVTGPNFRDVIYDIRATGEGELPHKRYLVQLYKEVMADWQNIAPEKKTAMIGAIVRGFREKHIMIYSVQPEVNEALGILKWSGTMDAASDYDYLFVADANLSANKSNHSIIRQMVYDVEIHEDGTLDSQLSINYDYPDAIAKTDPAVRPEHYGNINYFNRIQIFVPPNVVLNETDNFTEDVIEADTQSHTQFISAIIVDYNTAERVQLQYTNPQPVEVFGEYRRYRLQLQKQPGTQGDTVNVQVKLPAGATVVETSQTPLTQFSLEQPILEFRVNLVHDEWIEITYRQ